MEVTRIYKDMDVTYGELANALVQLGFRNVSEGKNFKYVNDKHHSVVLLPAPRQSENENLMKAYFATYSFALSEQGVIRQPDDLAKLIERNRLGAVKKRASSRQIPA